MEPVGLKELKEIFHRNGIPAEFRRDYWGQLQLAVPITVDPRRNIRRSAVFGMITEGQPILTELPAGRYLTVRVPGFYSWWEDLLRFPKVLQTANGIAHRMSRRELYPDFFRDYGNPEVISFAMNVPLKEEETVGEVLPEAFGQLCEIMKAVYGYLRKYEEAGE